VESYLLTISFRGIFNGIVFYPQNHCQQIYMKHKIFLPELMFIIVMMVCMITQASAQTVRAECIIFENVYVPCPEKISGELAD